MQHLRESPSISLRRLDLTRSDISSLRQFLSSSRINHTRRVLIPQVSLVETRSSRASFRFRSIDIFLAVATPLLSSRDPRSSCPYVNFITFTVICFFSRTFTLLSHFSNSLLSRSRSIHPRNTHAGTWRAHRHLHSTDFPPLYSLFDLESRSRDPDFASKSSEDFSCFYFTNDRASSMRSSIFRSLSLL